MLCGHRHAQLALRLMGCVDSKRTMRCHSSCARASLARLVRQVLARPLQPLRPRITQTRLLGCKNCLSVQKVPTDSMHALLVIGEQGICKLANNELAQLFPFPHH